MACAKRRRTDQNVIGPMPQSVNNISPPPAAEMRRIVKAYGPVRANDGVDWTLRAATIHALVGENGAGKTTLMRILAGLVRPDSGHIRIDGRPAPIRTPLEALGLGIGMVQQRPALVEAFTVAENVALAGGPGVDRPGSRRADEALRRLAEKHGFELDPHRRIADLTMGQRLRVEILKALAREPRILILDEPTSALAPPEVDSLFGSMRRLRDEGRSIVFITHRLPEVRAVADELTILRQGKVVGQGPAERFSEAQIARLMIGREPPPPRRALGKPRAGPAVLEIHGLCTAGGAGTGLDEFGLSIGAGEIVGLAGVDGNGQEDLVACLAGLRRAERGSIRLDGVEVVRASARKRLARGLATIPPDRSHGGLALAMTLGENLLLSHQRRRGFSVWGWVRPAALRRHARMCIERFGVEPQRADLPMRAFSGGNQQKALAAGRLAHPARALVAAYPTRGVDLGAVEAIHAQLLERRSEGLAVLLISADLDEIFALSDRVAALYRGRVVGVFEPTHENKRKVGLLMAGGKTEEELRNDG